MASVSSTMTPAHAASDRVRRYIANEAPIEQLGLLIDRVDTERAVKVGSGSLGVVLAAKDRTTGGHLAIKVISLKRVHEFGDGEGRIRQEVRAMHDVEHPNLVRLVDVLACGSRLPHIEWEPPYLCIAMEFVLDSEPLSNKLRRHGRSTQLASQVLPQLASALGSMHDRGVVHRDVWSENVLISNQGHAVLVDLGCAEYIHGESAHNSKLNIPYMSPEAASGQRQSVGDDCWALGLLITEMVTGMFVRDRMGRSDIPIHFAGPALSQAKRETIKLGTMLIQEITAGLLDLEASRRMTMADVLAHCRASGSTGAVPPVVSRNGMPTPSVVMRTSAATSSDTFSTISSAQTGPGGFYVGQRVTYLPRSHNIRRAAAVIGRVVGRAAWRIQLTNGVTKEVEDTDLWRLTPVESPGAALAGKGSGYNTFVTQASKQPMPTTPTPVRMNGRSPYEAGPTGSHLRSVSHPGSRNNTSAAPVAVPPVLGGGLATRPTVPIATTRLAGNAPGSLVLTPQQAVLLSHHSMTL